MNEVQPKIYRLLSTLDRPVRGLTQLNAQKEFYNPTEARKQLCEDSDDFCRTHSVGRVETSFRCLE
jgi:hypothetical protein